VTVHTSNNSVGLENTWRWFGPNDPVSLRHVRQTGATGIVTALHHIPIGELWTIDEISKRKHMIESEGMRWSVAESLPVHEDIKRGTGNYRKHIDNFRQSIANLGRCGVDTICYNFMPVLDWSRTDLHVEFKDGSIATKFEAKAFAAFDLFQLRRPGAEQDFTTDEITAAESYFDKLNDDQKETLKRTVLLGLPGSDETYTLEQLSGAIKNYEDIGNQGLRERLYAFLKEIVPVAAESGVSMAVHPDDPPRPLLGLPRIVSNTNDLDQLLNAVDSRSNGITFCTGSLGAGRDNNPVSMAERFANRISFIHLRNVTRNALGDFVEDNHLEGDVDMFGVMKVLVREQRRRINEGRPDNRMPMRPDHGHFMLADKQFEKVYPGYSLFGRMRGLAELRGLELGVRRSLGV
jgi:mannonate dehydratase